MPSNQCSHSDLAQFDYFDCKAGRGPGIRDPTCNICLEEVKKGEKSRTHNTCKTTFHEDCMDQWIETKIGPNDANSTASCPSCRGPIARLLEALQQGKVMHFVSRRDISRIDYLLSYGPAADFKARYLTRVNGSFRSYRVSAGASRSRHVLVDDVDRVQAGVLEVRMCAHETKFLLMTGEQVYHFLSELYVNGWDPTTGTRQPRMDLERMRGRSLPTIMQIASAFGVRDINHFELKFLFPNYPGWQRGNKMHIKLLHTYDRRQRARVEVLVYKMPTPNELIVAPQQVLVDSVSDLGGLGDNFMFKEIRDSVEVALMHNRVADITQPFP